MALNTVPVVLPNSGAKPLFTCCTSAMKVLEMGKRRMPARSLCVLLLPSSSKLMRSVKPLALILRGTPNSVLGRALALGWSRMKLYGLRESSGRFSMELVLSMEPRSVRPGSMTGAAPDTSTVVAVPPTCRLKSTVAVLPASSTIPVRVWARNPVLVTFRAYVPIGSTVKRKNPLLSVVSSRLSPVLTFSMVTVAPGITAPVGSVTVPSI